MLDEFDPTRQALNKRFNKLNEYMDQELIRKWVLGEITTKVFEYNLNRLEIKRDRMTYLKESDWTMLSDAPLSSEGRKLYRDYRQYLRDLPELYQNKQITEYNVMTFDEWQDDKPVYKSKKKVIL